MGVTPGKKTPKKTPKGKSPAEPEAMETTVTSPEKKTPVAATEKAVTPQLPSNGSEKKSESKQKKKSLKRKLSDDDYEGESEDVKSPVKLSEDDLSASQQESGKKQKKKKQKMGNEEQQSSDGAKNAAITSDEKEDEKTDAIPIERRLCVSSVGLEGMSKVDLKDLFKSHGYNVVHVFKHNKSRNAFVSFATEEEAKKALESVDKADCKGFMLSVETKDCHLSSLGLTRKKPGRLINKDGSADCTLYVSPVTPGMTKPKLLASFVGVSHVYYRKGGKKKSWARLECINSTVAKELHKSQQGKVVEGTALRLETPEEFRKRIIEEEVERVKQLQEQKMQEKKLEQKKKKQLKKKQEKKSKPEPEESSKDKSDESDDSEAEEDDDDDDEDDDDKVKVVSDDDDSEEEEAPPKMKKAKVAGKR